MKAHWLNDDESVLVTGTLDPAQALAFLDSEARAIMPGDEREGDVTDMLIRAREVTGKPERGNIIPQPPDAEYSWLWMESDSGRCRAVVFH